MTVNNYDKCCAGFNTFRNLYVFTLVKEKQDEGPMAVCLVTTSFLGGKAYEIFSVDQDSISLTMSI